MKSMIGRISPSHRFPGMQISKIRHSVPRAHFGRRKRSDSVSTFPVKRREGSSTWIKMDVLLGWPLSRDEMSITPV